MNIEELDEEYRKITQGEIPMDSTLGIDIELTVKWFQNSMQHDPNIPLDQKLSLIRMLLDNYEMPHDLEQKAREVEADLAIEKLILLSKDVIFWASNN